MAISLALAGLTAGAGMFQSFVGHSQKQQQVRDANRQIKAQNRFSMQNWQYNEQMRQRQNRNARAIYDMKKQEFSLQKELDYDAYKEFYEDSQLQFNNLVRDVKAKSFQSAMKLAAFQNQSTASALNLNRS
jgi:Na+-transporting NADH:ubiquinone oxidoreductase subunit NqrC